MSKFKNLGSIGSRIAKAATNTGFNQGRSAVKKGEITPPIQLEQMVNSQLHRAATYGFGFSDPHKQWLSNSFLGEHSLSSKMVEGAINAAAREDVMPSLSIEAHSITVAKEAIAKKIAKKEEEKKQVEVMYLWRDQSQSGNSSILEGLDPEESAQHINRLGVTRVEVPSGMSADAQCRLMGGEYFDVLQKFCEALDPDIKKQVLFRALVGGHGYQPVPTDVTEENIRLMQKSGVTDIRVFDALNSADNLAPAIDASLKYGLDTHVAYCFTKIKNRVEQAERFEHFLEDIYSRYGNQVNIDIKDMSAGMEVADVHSLMDVVDRFQVKHPEANHFLEIGKHSHAEQGYTEEANIAFIKRGGKRLDLASDSIGTHGKILKTALLLKDTQYDLGIDTQAAEECEAYLKKALPLFEPYKVQYPENIQQLARFSQAPGGSFGSTYARLNQIGQAHKMEQVLEEMGRIRKKLGDVALVTPVALFVTQQAVQKVIGGSDRPTKDIQNLVAGNFGPLEGVDPDYQEACMKARIEDCYHSLGKEEGKKLDPETLKVIINEIYYATEGLVEVSKTDKKYGDKEALAAFKEVLSGKASDKIIRRELLDITGTLRHETIITNHFSQDDCRKLLAAGTRNTVIAPVELLEPGLERAGVELQEFATKNNIAIRNFEHERALWASLNTGNPLDKPFQKFLELREKNDPSLFPASIESLQAKQQERQSSRSAVANKKETKLFEHNTAPFMEAAVEWKGKNLQHVIEQIQKIALEHLTAKAVREILYQHISESKGYDSTTLEAKAAVSNAMGILKEKIPAIAPVLNAEHFEENAEMVLKQREFVRSAVGDHRLTRIAELEAASFEGIRSDKNRKTAEEIEAISIELSVLKEDARQNLENALQTNKNGSVAEQKVTENPHTIENIYNSIKGELYQVALQQLRGPEQQQKSQGRAA